MSTSIILGSLFVHRGCPLLEINPRNVVRSICTRNLLVPRFPRRKIPNAYRGKKKEKNRVAKFQRIALMNFCFFIILLYYACKTVPLVLRILSCDFPFLFFFFVCVKETSKRNLITTVIGIKRTFIGTERYKFVMGRQMVFQL